MRRHEDEPAGAGAARPDPGTGKTPAARPEPGVDGTPTARPEPGLGGTSAARPEPGLGGAPAAPPPVTPAVRGSEPGPGAPDAAVDASASLAGDQPPPPPPADLSAVALLPTEERDRWALRLHRAVTGFVDEPRKAVEEADAVLGETAARVAELVKERRGGLPAKNDTEELRLALRDCRELTERMLQL